MNPVHLPCFWLIFTTHLTFHESNGIAFTMDKGSIHSRDYYGDTFELKHVSNCTSDICSNNRLREAGIQPGNQLQDKCICQCAPNFKTFRDDTGNCVNRIQGCLHATFMRENVSEENIPFIFLPSYGQLLHPSTPFSIPGLKAMDRIECNVIDVKYMTTSGWKQLYPTSSEISSLFTFIKNENRMFLQWNGKEQDVKSVTSHLVKVLLHCKQTNKNGSDQEVRPCVSFRVAGTNIGMSTLRNSEKSESSNGRPNNYVIIGLSVGLLGLIYVIALFIFLSVRKRKVQARRMLALQAKVKEMEEANDSNSYRISDHQYDTLEEVAPDNFQRTAVDASSSTYGVSNQINGMATAIVNHNSTHMVENFQESVPEENVCIEETVNSKENTWPKQEDDMKSVPGKSSSNSKRIYFNPAFFDRDMLASPPPAAEEFARKIQEMISVAKNRIKNKKYNPKLQVVPEDDYFYHDFGDLLESIDSQDDEDFKVEPQEPKEHLKAPTIIPRPFHRKVDKGIKQSKISKAEEVDEKQDVVEAKEIDTSKVANEPFAKIRKLNIPPPPPPAIGESEETRILEETNKSKDNGLSQFDLFRLDLENKIRDLNITRQQSKPLKSHKFKKPVASVEIPAQKTREQSVQDWLSKSQSLDEANGKNPNLSHALSSNQPPKSLNDKTTGNHCNAFKLPSMNLLCKIQKEETQMNEKQLVHRSEDDSGKCYDNHVVKLDLSFEEEEEESVPKTTIHVNGADSQTAASKDFSTKISIESSPTVIQISTDGSVFGSQRGICEKSPYVRKKCNSTSIVMITNDDEAVLQPVEIHKPDVNINDLVNEVPKLSNKILNEKNKNVVEGTEETNLSSDSAIEDTSISNSPVDSNSEESVEISDTPKHTKQNTNDHLTLCHDNIFRMDDKETTEKFPTNPETSVDFRVTQNFMPVEMWLKNSEERCYSFGSDSYGSQSSTLSTVEDGSLEPNLDDGRSNRTEDSFHSLPESVNIVSHCEGNDGPRSLPISLNSESRTMSPKLLLPVVKGLKPFSPVKPPRKIQLTKRSEKNNSPDSGKDSAATVDDLQEEEKNDIVTRDDLATDENQRSPIINVQDWLLSTDDDEDEKEIIPSSVSVSSEFNPKKTMFRSQFAMADSSVSLRVNTSPLINHDAENQIDNIDGKKISSRKLNRRRPVKARLKDTKRKLKTNKQKKVGSDSDSDYGHQIDSVPNQSNSAKIAGKTQKENSKVDSGRKKALDPSSNEKEKLVIAQETLLNQIAHNLHKSASDRSNDSSLEKNSASSSTAIVTSKTPELPKSMDRSKLNALLNGDISGDETIL